MKYKKYSILQSNRMTILMTNGIGDWRTHISSYLIDLDEVLELDPYLFHPLTFTSYFFILINSSN
jgi:hypothetical protein